MERLSTLSAGGASTTATGNRAAFWARDQWRVASGLTLTGGVRVDVNRGSVPDRGVVFKTSPVSPRIGLVWDVGTKHRTAIKAHYGRYADSLLLNRIAFLDTAGQHPQIFSVPDGNGGFVETLRVTPTVSNRLIDADISHSYVDQFVTGIEHVIARDLTAQAMSSRRHFDNFMALVDMTSQWEQVERSDPGPDGRPDTSDDGGTVHPYRLLNFGNETICIRIRTERFADMTRCSSSRRSATAIGGSCRARSRGRRLMARSETAIFRMPA